MNRQCSPSGRRQVAGFTLLELLTVVLIILVLAGVLVGVAEYLRARSSVNTARAQLAALGAAIEAFKADNGYYPTSTIYRISARGLAEVTNSWLLCAQLTQPKPYLKTDSGMITKQHGLTVLRDPWGNPWNYFRPVTNEPWQTVNLPNKASYVLGGLVNIASYDLWSYGPDGVTAVPGAQGYAAGIHYWHEDVYSSQRDPSQDDITNWRH